MVKINLRYRGLNLSITLAYLGYYARTPLYAGKTLYQMLFEELVDSKGTTPRQIMALCKRNAPYLDESNVKRIKRIIETAAAQSTNIRVSNLRFIRFPRGGHGPSINRTSPIARYTAEEREIIHRVLNSMPNASAVKVAQKIKRIFSLRGLTMPPGERSRLLKSCRQRR
jgi:hypothetical protein